MKIFDNRITNIDLAKILRDGGLVVVPSDTVYGMMVDATNEKAVRKLLQFKNRPIGKPISVFVSDWDMLERTVEITDKQKETVSQLLPGPFTIVLPSRNTVCALLESERKTLGVRIPIYPFITDLVKEYGVPVTATSANISGRSPHYRVDSFLNDLTSQKKELIDCIVDAGHLPHNKPSTVIDMSGSDVKIVRRGDIVWANERTFVSESENQTKKIAAFILEKVTKHFHDKAVVMILQGDLGAGKTIFVKGMAESVGVDNVISPTYVIYYEYETNKEPLKKLYHFDLYQIEETNEFEHLGIKEMLKPGALLAMEWGEKSGEIFEMLKEKAYMIYIRFEYVDEKKRKIVVNY